MKLNPDLLMKLLQLINESSKLPGNEWASLKLKEIYGNNLSDNTGLLLQNISERLQLVEQYLSLKPEHNIDYSAFPENIRNVLVRDNIEMGRYETGTTNHKIDFLEFCRYAHKQLEGMLNYFMINLFNNDSSQFIKFYIQYFYDPEKSSRKPTQISEVTSMAKIFIFLKLTSCSKEMKDNLYFLNHVRNGQSHSKFTGSKDKENKLDTAIEREYNQKMSDKNFSQITTLLEQFKDKILKTDSTVISEFIKKRDQGTIGERFPDLMQQLLK